MIYVVVLINLVGNTAWIEYAAKSFDSVAACEEYRAAPYNRGYLDGTLAQQFHRRPFEILNEACLSLDEVAERNKWLGDDNFY